MGISQSETRFSNRTREGVFSCHCDRCGLTATKDGDTPGDAADAARNCGYITVPSKNLADPSEWRCPGCASNKETHHDEKTVKACLECGGDRTPGQLHKCPKRNRTLSNRGF